LDNIFGNSANIDSFGKVHPIQMKNWDKFDSHVNALMISKNHLQVTDGTDIPLLDRIVIMLQDERVVDSLIELFGLATRSDEFILEIDPDGIGYFFINEHNQRVDSGNYEEIRKVILYQNIIIEPKVYKDPKMQEWANKVLEAKNKDGANITVEDMVTTVATFSGKHYWDIANYSMYQLKSEFMRINKFKTYDTTSIMFANPYASDIKLDHFAEYLDLYADPYKDVFKSKDNMKINKALQG
jgi:hypothetical protein